LDVVAENFQPQTTGIPLSVKRLHHQQLMLEGLIKVIESLVGRAEATVEKLPPQSAEVEMRILSLRRKTLSRALLLHARTKIENAILSTVGEGLLALDISCACRHRRKLLAQVQHKLITTSIFTT
jgi:hypothetical protein